MTADIIAGFGSVIFSALIGFAIFASEKDIQGIKVGRWVSAILAVSILGFLAFPATVTCGWNSLDTESRILIVALDILSATAAIMLGLYFFRYFRFKGWSKQNIEAVFPPDKPLID